MKVKVEISGEVAALLDTLGAQHRIFSTSGPLRGSVRRAGVIEALATGRISGTSAPEATCVYCRSFQPCTNHFDLLVCIDRAACEARIKDGLQ
jgi:hypothetical protein